MKLTILYRSILFVFLLYYVPASYASPNILILGDSLSAGYGLKKNESWVVLLEEKLTTTQLDYKVVNASVSGATSADGLQSLPKLINIYHPKILVVGLGSNDGLRGNPIANMETNLADIIKLAQQNKINVLLIGFQLPQNYGKTYSTQFANVFTNLSKKYKIPLVPFMLEGFAADLAYFQNDKLHPNATAQQKILNNIWPYLQPMLK